MPRCWNEVKERKQVSKLLWCLGSRISLGWPRKSRAGWHLKTFRIGSPNHHSSKLKKKAHRDGLLVSNGRRSKRTCSPSSGSCTYFSQRALITLLSQLAPSSPEKKLKINRKRPKKWRNKGSSEKRQKGLESRIWWRMTVPLVFLKLSGILNSPTCTEIVFTRDNTSNRKIINQLLYC